MQCRTLQKSFFCKSPSVSARCKKLQRSKLQTSSFSKAQDTVFARYQKQQLAIPVGKRRRDTQFAHYNAITISHGTTVEEQLLRELPFYNICHNCLKRCFGCPYEGLPLYYPQGRPQPVESAIWKMKPSPVTLATLAREAILRQAFNGKDCYLEEESPCISVVPHHFTTSLFFGDKTVSIEDVYYSFHHFLGTRRQFVQSTPQDYLFFDFDWLTHVESPTRPWLPCNPRMPP